MDVAQNVTHNVHMTKTHKNIQTVIMGYNSTIKNLSGDSSQKITMPNTEPKGGKQPPQQQPRVMVSFTYHFYDRHTETR